MDSSFSIERKVFTQPLEAPTQIGDTSKYEGSGSQSAAMFSRRQKKKKEEPKKKPAASNSHIDVIA